MSAPVREAILLRLHKVLQGENPEPQFEKLLAADRQAILEILKETAPDLTAGW
jgi:hypothetical protein